MSTLKRPLSTEVSAAAAEPLQPTKRKCLRSSSSSCPCTAISSSSPYCSSSLSSTSSSSSCSSSYSCASSSCCSSSSSSCSSCSSCSSSPSCSSSSSSLPVSSLLSGTPVSIDASVLDSIDAVKKILEVVCHLTGLGFSAVARVTEDRWIACSVRDNANFGLKPGDELAVVSRICNEIREHGRTAVMIENVKEEEDQHHVTSSQQFGFQSYLSFPIFLPSDGRFFGTLCALDPEPIRFNTSLNVTTLKLFAELIAQHIETQERLKLAELLLLQEREVAKLREQFVAVLGHDLRNPLSAIACASQLLLSEDKDNELLHMIDQSAMRMFDLISNILDFARGRLGGGISVTLTLHPDLPSKLRQVVSELQTAQPSRVIKTEINIHKPILLDADRIAQLLSNLIANALTYGDASSPVLVRASSQGSIFEISVTNYGPTISHHILPHLFKPFTRGRILQKQGLGLGLYIVNEIAKAHQGSMSVTSQDDRTTFTFQMPIPIEEPMSSPRNNGGELR